MPSVFSVTAIHVMIILKVSITLEIPIPITRVLVSIIIPPLWPIKRYILILKVKGGSFPSSLVIPMMPAMLMSYFETLSKGTGESVTSPVRAVFFVAWPWVTKYVAFRFFFAREQVLSYARAGFVLLVVLPERARFGGRVASGVVGAVYYVAEVGWHCQCLSFAV
ncbi:hypothetical protein EJ02DRAFT_14454 [Clathrospora elynae]|uniref:Uncharacterized protein n=1 Tax=Clathrospora elynae TaxID=706981 RepID=A0A6A5T198_9PLEO|nr:hypothetical protein EJ02DRAFT_14454 [Clathrospora elynae]